MPLHSGRIYIENDVSIRPPHPEAIRNIAKATDVADSVEKWLSRAVEHGDVYYFSIYWEKTLVGQIFLHDIDQQSGEALIGYHLFEPRYRGLGIGTKALGLLQKFVVECTDLTRLIIITSSDNVASQRIAQKCGFINAGTPREDPIHGVLFEWNARNLR